MLWKVLIYVDSENDREKQTMYNMLFCKYAAYIDLYANKAYENHMLYAKKWNTELGFTAKTQISVNIVHLYSL